MSLRRAVLPLLLAVAACTRQEPVRVAVGVSDAVARPLLSEFGDQRSVPVDARCTDCDVLWSADLDTAMALQAGGSFATLPGGDYGRPASMVDPDHRWVASSAVARVIVYDPDRVREADAPAKVVDLARPEVARQLILADPTRGNAAWHAAALFAALGEPRARELYRAVLGGGAQVVRDEDAVIAALLAGERPIALTDSDRAFAAQEKQPTLVVLLPDQDTDGNGVLLLPAVVALTRRGAANPSSRALLDFLLSAPVARRMAMTTDTLFVLNDPAEVPAGILGIHALRVMPVSYADLAARLPAVRGALAGTAMPS
jgi:iron(III) transport system substrate-binding protein